MRLLIVLLAAAGLTAPVAQSSDTSTGRQAVLATIHALDTALVAKDAAALGALLEPDFVGTVPSGVALARDAYIAFHTRANEGLVAIEPAAGTEPTVRLLDGRFAVVNRRVAVRRADSAGKVEAFEVQRIEVLRLDDGRWRMVAGQGTRVQH
jgi:uncharacterized protein (TIGR02246 family)